MTILFVGNSLSDFFADVGTSADMDSVTTGDGIRDPLYTHNEISCRVARDESNPFNIALGGIYDDVWLHFRMRYAQDPNRINGSFIKFIAGAMPSDPYLGRILHNKSFLGTAVQDSSSEQEDYGNLQPIDLFEATFDIRMRVGASNTLDLYVNGSLVSSSTIVNDTAFTGIQHINFQQQDMSINYPFAEDNTRFSEFIVTQGESTIGWRLAQLLPAGAGYYDDFVGSYADIADDNFTTAVSAGLVDSRISAALSTYNGPATSANVRAVIAKSMVSRGDVGPTSFKHFLRHGATDYEGANTPVGIDNQNYMTVWDVDPATSAPWDTATFSSMETGLKTEA